MADGTNVISMTPPTAPVTSRRRHRFPKAIGDALCASQRRIDEARATLRLLEQHVNEPPFGDPDYGIVCGAIDAVIRLLAPVEGLDQPIELEMQGKALAAKEAK